MIERTRIGKQYVTANIRQNKFIVVIGKLKEYEAKISRKKKYIYNEYRCWGFEVIGMKICQWP
jgi:uncharacterized protein (UPF0335 family)